MISLVDECHDYKHGTLPPVVRFDTKTSSQLSFGTCLHHTCILRRSFLSLADPPENHTMGDGTLPQRPNSPPKDLYRRLLPRSTTHQVSAPLDKPLFLRLPLDVILAITDHLKPEDIFLLSLSCTTLLASLSRPKWDDLPTAGKNRFLEALVRDMTRTHYFCPECSQLLVYDEADVFKLNADYHDRLWKGRKCWLDSFFPMSFWGANCLKLDYHFAHQVMNRHFFGAPAGLPTEILDSETWAYFPYDMDRPLNNQLRWDVRVGARIINDELYLAAVHRLKLFKYSPCCPALLTAPWLCRHLDAADWETTKPKTMLGLHIPNKAWHRSCQHCPSDFTYEISSFDGCWLNLTIQGFHLLGGARRMADWRQRLWTRRVSEKVDTCGIASYAAGAIKNAWQTGGEGGSRETVE